MLQRCALRQLALNNGITETKTFDARIRVAQIQAVNGAQNLLTLANTYYENGNLNTQSIQRPTRTWPEPLQATMASTA
jgi:hypothetical protein